MQIFPYFALAMLTTLEQISSFFQRAFVKKVRQRSITYNWGTGIFGDVTFVAKIRRIEGYIFNANFSQFCISNADDTLTYIFIIPAQCDGELYARGRPGIAWDTGVQGDVTLIARYRHSGANIFNANFSLFCVSNIDDSWTDIFIIPARSCQEKYARFRSGIICDTGIFGDVTFIARNRRTEVYIYIQCKFFPILR